MKKKNGTLHLCIDYQELNKGSQLFLKIDLRYKYHQLKMKAEDVEKTVDSRRPKHSDKKYTELAESISKILPKIQHLSFFKWLSKMIGPPDIRRKDRRCEYHKDYSYETDNYYAVKDHFEELVQDDRLALHVRKGNPPNTVALCLKSSPLGVIHMIYSLSPPTSVHTIQLQPSLSKPFTLAKQPHKTAKISFNYTDLEGVTLPHDDALVIELRVNKFVIERVLIDQGSTTEIMYHKTFLKLGFTNLDLLLVEYPLFGFNANPEYPLGKITLSIRTGTKAVDVEFLVVKLALPYNLIMGRTLLHTMQAVPSTYHQLLRFPTQHGIEPIRGSQKSAKACYLIALAKRSKELEVNSIEFSN
ncbi:uncharacterized protein LOC114257966 [Camellia sinensis]|uniref:uncharacterized protein LOC114257966 n=1 Tax=Camellia sinensis TaxID=4442 RepID=UPI0010361663|nr:uncharacterized protein LOC114257966 [Camellia sinensis]